jgi:hypothetical protein
LARYLYHNFFIGLVMSMVSMKYALFAFFSAALILSTTSALAIEGYPQPMAPPVIGEPVYQTPGRYQAGYDTSSGFGTYQPGQIVPAPVTHDMGVGIRKIFMMGKGIVISPSDSADFKMLKVIIAEVTLLEEDFGLGLLVLDYDKYKLKNLNIDENSGTGSILEDDVEVGTFTVTKVQKPETEVWAGTLTIHSTIYYMYVIGVTREFGPVEQGDRVGEFCMMRPDVCAGASQEICEANPQDSNCIRVMATYCAENRDDTRCRHTIQNICEQDPNAAGCVQGGVQIMNCIRCLLPHTDLCGLTEERCGWNAVLQGGGRVTPRCEPTELEGRCIEEKARIYCEELCMPVMTARIESRVAPERVQVPPEMRPTIPVETIPIQPIAGEPMGCVDACANSCPRECVVRETTADVSYATVDASCMFQCKINCRQQCEVNQPLEPIQIQIYRPCPYPLQCLSVANIPSGCSQLPEYSCAAQDVAEEYMCVLCPTVSTPVPEPLPAEVVAVCGNGICEEGEDMDNCEPDCAAQPATSGGTSSGEAVTIETTESDEGTTEIVGGGETANETSGETGTSTSEGEE